MLAEIFYTNYYCTCYLYGAVRNGFEAGRIHYKGYWKGWALEIETILGLEMATSEANVISRRNTSLMSTIFNWTFHKNKKKVCVTFSPFHHHVIMRN